MNEPLLGSNEVSLGPTQARTRKDVSNEGCFFKLDSCRGAFFANQAGYGRADKMHLPGCCRAEGSVLLSRGDMQKWLSLTP